MENKDVVYAHRMTEIPMKSGVCLVPASLERLVFDENVIEFPHISVTMGTFGSFDVTHTKSGFMMIGGFERAINAFIAMAELQLALNELGIDAGCSADELREAILSEPKECATLGMSIPQWIHIHKTVAGFNSEFPWETEDDSPHAKFAELLKKLPSRPVEKPVVSK